jgi:hypothetical protein
MMSNDTLYTRENINKLTSFCQQYCEIYDEFIKETQLINSPLPHQVISSDILKRFRITTDALLQVMPLLLKHPNHKMSVFLLLRSQLSDLLAYLCLWTFIDKENPNDQTAYKNESDLFDLDLFVAMEIMYEQNIELSQFGEIGKILSSQDEARNTAIKAHLYEVFKNLVDPETNKPYKKPAKIRSTTDAKFFKTPDEKNQIFKSEAKKIERIKEYGDDATKEIMAPAFSAFKYFSQFQHYSRASMDFFRHANLNHDIINIVTSLTQLNVVSHLQYRHLTGDENKYSTKMKELLDLLGEIAPVEGQN